MQDIDVIRVTETKYAEYIKIANQIEISTDSGSVGAGRAAFPEQNGFPTVDELEEHRAGEHLREYLPYLLYYDKAFKHSTPEFEETKKYIDALLEYVDIVEDKDVKKIKELTAEKWKGMTLQERAETFAPLMEYYNPGEFDNFIKDLDYYKFMSFYGCTKLKYRTAGKYKGLVKDLHDIWDIVQRM